MATPLDLQEQEQVDALKAFWKQYGALLTWALVIALGSYAAWNGWKAYERDRATKAGALFEELDKSLQAADLERAARVQTDLRERYPGTAWAAQGALTLSRAQFDGGKPDEALASLQWVMAHAESVELRALARLRAAGLHLDAGRHEEALKMLEPAELKGFEALAADRRGDVFQAQGKAAQAVEAYREAFNAMPQTLEYRRVVEAKLTALGASASTAAEKDVATGASK